MITDKLIKAREYELNKEQAIKSEERPAFHLSTRVGWMNDPNGFSYYKGKYHMFYQYYPYETNWGPMHWGHAVSEDMLHWEYLPVALAPDEKYDEGNGCFSGSAIELENGRHLLMYTGVERITEADGSTRDIQAQCVATGDGLDYVKYDKNPVITADKLPEGSSKYDFRDPKIWKNEDGTYSAVVGNVPTDGSGQIVLFTSPDGYEWNFKSILIENKWRFGNMWECPDFFKLDDNWVLLTSPCGMEAEGLEYVNGSGTLCLIGDYDEQAGKFTPKHNQCIDYGIDFYAPQSILTPDGRRVMIGWMQNWATLNMKPEGAKWFGQMTIPRELSIRNGRLYQMPAREIESLRHNKVEYHNIVIETDRYDEDGKLVNCGHEPLGAGDEKCSNNSVEVELAGISGRCVDMDITVETDSRFALRFAMTRDEDALNKKANRYYTELCYNPAEETLTIDRKYSGSRVATIHERKCQITSIRSAYENNTDRNNIDKLKLRIIIDRYSAEIFVNDGEKALTVTMYTRQDADRISFIADNKAVLDIVKYDL